ncbi:calcium and integrin-binding family member 2 isoform X9 [Eumetopias jubatus]|uniref:calcium and integrin-binding family member 2 isoform X9 n=1 Tax=Eumetopias jubatus TaxID=34886 RepID=UPI0010168D99|nr:calcium and integrin-binding family member 2 isoform X9 [Eumetopias jubatus]
MGNKQTIFTEEQLDNYQDCTFFNKKDILKLHARFYELAPNLVPMDYRKSPIVHVPMSLIIQMPELRVRERPLLPGRRTPSRKGSWRLFLRTARGTSPSTTLWTCSPCCVSRLPGSSRPTMPSRSTTSTQTTSSVRRTWSARWHGSPSRSWTKMRWCSCVKRSSRRPTWTATANWASQTLRT